MLLPWRALDLRWDRAGGQRGARALAFDTKLQNSLVVGYSRNFEVDYLVNGDHRQAAMIPWRGQLGVGSGLGLGGVALYDGPLVLDKVGTHELENLRVGQCAGTHLACRHFTPLGMAILGGRLNGAVANRCCTPLPVCLQVVFAGFPNKLLALNDEVGTPLSSS